MGMLRTVGELAGTMMLEALWPTRCAVCDKPGSLLCDACRLKMRYVDYWDSCRRCGAPFGRLQCSECSSMALEDLGISELPYEECVFAFRMTEDTSRLISVYKDLGEQRLCHILAQAMVDAIPSRWMKDIDACTYVPVSQKNFAKRGFDQGRLLAETLSDLLGLPLMQVFDRPVSLDQRTLGRSERFANMSYALKMVAGCDLTDKGVLFIDDVSTTGSTFLAAAEAMKRSGCQKVYCTAAFHS